MILWRRLWALCVAVLGMLLRLTSWPRRPSLVVPLLRTSAEPLQSLTWIVSYFFLVWGLIFAAAIMPLLVLVVLALLLILAFHATLLLLLEFVLLGQELTLAFAAIVQLLPGCEATGLC